MTLDSFTDVTVRPLADLVEVFLESVVAPAFFDADCKYNHSWFMQM